jgi:citronellol/citronellal dehydrogenase
VTGGGTGIGRAIALELASVGADVALLGRRAEPLEKVRAEIEALGRRAVALPADVREVEQVASAVAHTKDALGPIDVLVNNAGGHFVAPAEQLKTSGWNAVVNTNLNGTFNVTREVATQHMIPSGGGAIVNIVIDMWLGTPGAAHAGAARAAVENLTKSLASEWARHRIRVNAVAPGTVDTGGLAQYPQEVKSDLEAVIPLARFGRPEEIAWTVAYLVGESGAWITGETVAIDGGARLWGGVRWVYERAMARVSRAPRPG